MARSNGRVPPVSRQSTSAADGDRPVDDIVHGLDIWHGHSRIELPTQLTNGRCDVPDAMVATHDQVSLAERASSPRHIDGSSRGRIESVVLDVIDDTDDAWISGKAK